MKNKIYTDRFGNVLFVGDKVHDKWGYDLEVCEGDDGDYYGKLVCEPGHSCENIPYSLEPAEDLEKVVNTAEEYSFNIPSKLFPTLNKEQQEMWKKEIEQAFENGRTYERFQYCKRLVSYLE